MHYITELSTDEEFVYLLHFRWHWPFKAELLCNGVHHHIFDNRVGKTKAPLDWSDYITDVSFTGVVHQSYPRILCVGV